ncbi:thiolase family protein [Pradoshia sp. D12]|uniref:thiolase family protein n=1 Tax=Bacillaceae TaxID=186817 RepID=UPI0011296499|nr:MULTISPECIES: thiolase family protein [Bacillaceae]QFK71571.1 thiolase family protein [Pradoshia sp. D12]TPF73366.1 thiolase family protein [Bacillus sp. D12]
MRNAVIVEAVRTAVGKIGGSLKNEEVDYLASATINGLIERTGVQKDEIDEVIIGQAKQSTDQPNLARLALLRAGLAIETPGYTVHRQCGSGVQAIHNGVQQIMCGLSDIVIAGGAESMSQAPFYLRNARYGFGTGNTEILDSNTESQPRAQPIETYGHLTMGMTAENLAEKYSITREEQDEYALLSQEKAERAISSGLFNDQIIPYQIKTKKGTEIFKVDEHPRKTSMEQLARLKPVFKKNGTVTAGNSSGRNDGAGLVMLMAEETAIQKGYKCKAKIIAQAVAGVSPDIMGIGPAPATRKALKLAGLKLEDIGLIELNEAFAAQTLAVIKEMDLDTKRLNVNGGAIALGHPIGGTGGILMTKLIHEMERRGEKYGLVTFCIGGGLGISSIVENLQV